MAGDCQPRWCGWGSHPHYSQPIKYGEISDFPQVEVVSRYRAQNIEFAEQQEADPVRRS
jgi:hypothetical protein